MTMRVLKIVLTVLVCGVSIFWLSCASKTKPAEMSDNQTVMVQRGDLAVAITATRHLQLFDGTAFAQLVKEQSAVVLKNKGFQNHREWGTTLTQNVTNALGVYPVQNFRYGQQIGNEKITGEGLIDAKGKRVVIIGGGDTGADCVGTAHRQGASCVVQIEVLPRPEECRTDACPWPNYPLLLKTTSSHEEGGQRQWAVSTKRFIGEKGAIKKLSCVNAEREFEIDADLVIIAVGFLHPAHTGLLGDLRVD